MPGKSTWRDFLAELIQNNQERQRIAAALGVNPITLTRWTNGSSSPRIENLRALLDAMPEHSPQLFELIRKEYPLLENYDSAEDSIFEMPEIPATFYSHILNAYTTSPHILREVTIATMVIQQALRQLDPLRQGLRVIVAQCTPPLSGKKVQSLNCTYSKGTFAYVDYDELRFFLGAESVAGQTVTKGHPLVVQSKREAKMLFPIDPMLTDYVESIVGYPIMSSDLVAGCMIVISPQINFFSALRLDLISNFAKLFTLAIDIAAYYPIEQLQLVSIPSYKVQENYIQTFQRRVAQTMMDETSSGKSIRRMDAELQVLQQLETELIEYSLNEWRVAQPRHE